ncbi:MAG: TonB-dependent receptor [Paludibacter sp.]|nr:TonB-dependent receptor [Paludibacter sp.]
MNPFRIYTLIIVTLVSIGAYGAGDGLLHGRVTYPDGSPAENVVVQVNNTAIIGISDEKGLYELEQVPFGAHHLIVKPFGSAIQVVSVELSTAKLRFDIRLKSDKGHKELKEVEVRAKSKSQLLKSSGYSVGIVETQQMALQSVQTSELLDRTAGVRLRQTGGMGSATEFTINGLSGNSVRVFIDGIPVRNYGSSFSVSSLAPEQIERIEVYKGVVPAHLSEDALGGAINVVLKKNIRSNNAITASYSLGSFNTHQANLNGNYRNDSTGFTVIGSGFYNYTDNNYEVWGDQVFVSEPPTWALEYVKARRFHDSYQSYGLNMDAGFTNVKWADRFLIGALYSEMDKDVQHGGTMEVVYGNRRTGQNTKMLNLRYDKRAIGDKLDVNAFVSVTEANRWVTDTVPHIYNWLGNRLWNDRTNDYYSWNVGGGEAGKATLATNVERTLAGRANASYRLSNNHRLSANYLLNRFTRDVVDPLLPAAEQELTETRYMTKQILGLTYDTYWLSEKLKTSVFWKFYHQQVSLSDPVKINNVLTAQAVDKSNTNNGYGMALSYTFRPDWLLLASFEKAVRLPESSELLGNTSDNVDAAYNLNPESAYNFNLGVQSGPFEWGEHVLRSDVNFFFRDIRDMIMRGAESTSTGTYSFENLGQILSRGFDLEMNYNYRKKLSVNFNLSLFNARYNLRYDAHGKEYSYYGDRLRNAPYFTSNTYAEYDFGSVIQKNSSLRLNYNFAYIHRFFRNWESIGGAGKAVIPTQMIHDVGLLYSFPNERLSVSVNGKNLLNAQAFDNWALQKPGRAVYAKLSYTFL